MKKPTRFQELAGIKIIKENISIDSIGASDIHILNNNNSSVEQKEVEGGTLSFLRVNLVADLSPVDINNLMTELKLIKEKLDKANAGPAEQ